MRPASIENNRSTELKLFAHTAALHGGHPAAEPEGGSIAPTQGPGTMMLKAIKEVFEK